MNTRGWTLRLLLSRSSVPILSVSRTSPMLSMPSVWGGDAPCALNAANEIAVAAFLRGEISFTDMSRLLYEVMSRHKLSHEVALSTFVDTDSRTRRIAESLLPIFRR